MSAIIPVFIPHAGCPHDCVFCNQRDIAGRSAPPSPDQVQSEVRAALRHSGAAPELAFYGGSFTALPAAEQVRYLDAVAPLLDQVSGLRISTRPDAVDEETLTRLRAYRVRTIELGAQSMSDEVLRRAGRGHTAADTVRAARLVRAHGFSLVLQMMAGLPGDSEHGALATARALCALAPDAVRIYPVVVLRGTALAELWRDGRYEPLTVERAAELCARVLEVFEQHGVQVIRIGLNPSEMLEGAVLAGAYHPAFGALVRGELYYRRACAALGVPHGASVTLAAHPRRLSLLSGQNARNRTRLMEKFRLKSLTLRGENVPDGEVVRIEELEKIYKNKKRIDNS